MSTTKLLVFVHKDHEEVLYDDIASIGIGHRAHDLVLVPIAAVSADSTAKPITLTADDYDAVDIMKVTVEDAKADPARVGSDEQGKADGSATPTDVR